MKKLGISIYPERSTFEKDAAYIDLAAKYGFTRLFTSLLEITGDQQSVISSFKKVVEYAKKRGLEVTIDINPAIFKQLGVSHNDLAFYKELGADVIRLDGVFTGAEEALMTRNPHGLKVEINLSNGTSYIDNIMAFKPNTENLYTSHNFYPMRYSGLSLKHFKKCLVGAKKHNLRTLAFITSPSGKLGPWPHNDGLATLEMHRHLPLTTQLKHLLLVDSLDDISIGNAYATEEELAALSALFFATEPQFSVVLEKESSQIERAALFEHQHQYRRDWSDYLIRSSVTRSFYTEADIPKGQIQDIKRGDVLLGNNGFAQYKGELQIALVDTPNDGNVNVIGHIVEEEMFLLDIIEPGQSFKLKEK